jgi:hypothetical protein
MSLRDDDGGPAAATNTPIRLAGVDSYDPEGDNKEEHDEKVGNATDGDPATYWNTESYESEFTKSGVGLVLDAGKEVEPKAITITTDTPGFKAEIREGDSSTGPFETRVSDSQTVEDRTTFDLTDAKSRYFLVWITALDEIARIHEVRAS